MTTLTIRLPEDLRRRLHLVSGLETARRGEKVSVSDVVRRGIEVVTSRSAEFPAVNPEGRDTAV
jgi:predicted transcriptional regulator